MKFTSWLSIFLLLCITGMSIYLYGLYSTYKPILRNKNSGFHLHEFSYKKMTQTLLYISHNTHIHNSFPMFKLGVNNLTSLVQNWYNSSNLMLVLVNKYNQFLVFSKLDKYLSPYKLSTLRHMPLSIRINQAKEQYSAILKKMNIFPLVYGLDIPKKNPKYMFLIMKISWETQTFETRSRWITTLWKTWANICIKSGFANTAKTCRLRLFNDAQDVLGSSHELGHFSPWVKE